jgi:ankyrin repeat protein
VGCSEPRPTEIRARVIDADTFEGIPGAIVLARYQSYGPMGQSGSSCFRGESVVSDEAGWFTLRVDPGPGLSGPHFQAYKRGYVYVLAPRVASCTTVDRCNIRVAKLDADGNWMTWYDEPEIFPNHEAAEKASRQFVDTYLKHVDLNPADRRHERRGDARAGICVHTGLFTAGPRPYLEAIYAEQVELDEEAVWLKQTRDAIDAPEKLDFPERVLPPQKSDADLKARVGPTYTALMDAASRCSVDEVGGLLQRGADPNSMFGGFSALSLAIDSYHGSPRSYAKRQLKNAEQCLTTIRLILNDPRSDPNVRQDHWAYTPLMEALTGPSEAVRLLLQAGADPNLTANGGRDSTLGIAMGANLAGIPQDERVLDLLLADRRLDIDHLPVQYGQSALEYAVGLGNETLVTKLLAAGADPNTTHLVGYTPLCMAVTIAIANPQRANYVATVRTLARAPGIRIDTSCRGKTPFQMAQDAVRSDLMELRLR